MIVAAKHRLRMAALLLLLAWIVAGVANAQAWLFGSAPTTFGVVATLVAVCAWPVFGWFAGRRSLRGFIRLATLFWVVVVVGTPVAFFPARTKGGETPGTLMLGVLYFVLTGPPYGLSAVLPPWDLWARAVLIDVVLFAVTLVAYLAGTAQKQPSAKEGFE